MREEIHAFLHWRYLYVDVTKTFIEMSKKVERKKQKIKKLACAKKEMMLN